MRKALDLARQGLGRVWPNPSVGCVLVQSTTIVGEGATQPGGRPHAEVVAIHQAGPMTEGATAYVSLEPCAHYGRTPPCALALIRAGVTECHIAITDPDPRVNGKGVRMLKDAGISVALGLLKPDAQELNAGFFLRVQTGRPLVTAVTPPYFNQEQYYHDAHLETAFGGLGVWANVRGTGVAPVRWWLGGDLPLGGYAWRQFECTMNDEGIDVQAMLGQLGAHGLTRVLVPSDDPLTTRLHQLGLVDRKLGFESQSRTAR
ncbi:MAG: bifunctional diaminohydroxyphosphoribosylaminopyrimidine deaminase/5-amino-6-(5-phosphoribosylamino)uracil reductase RibD [Myxococcales bacterium]|nr:bifunctional diaminohydroxyphosphoribosylaminopyrimidine deaminase/5-amino-6-(5-phosphoribosylamino)uracil reductase RibD [Myxococcales bacterium]